MEAIPPQLLSDSEAPVDASAGSKEIAEGGLAQLQGMFFAGKNFRSQSNIFGKILLQDGGRKWEGPTSSCLTSS